MSSQNAIESGYEYDGEMAFLNRCDMASLRGEACRGHRPHRRYLVSPLCLLERGRGLAERIPYGIVALVSRNAVAFGAFPAF
jgi:hypothetical protein